MRKQFKTTILDLAAGDPRIVLLFGDISVFLFQDFQTRFPDRFYNIGICENTIVSMGAGLSSQGFIPILHTIAPFITERSYEQIKLDLCYNRFPAKIVSCGASFDYAWDGATHHCYTDLAILRLLPHLEVIQPGNRQEFDLLLRSRYRSAETTYYRLSDHSHGEAFPIEFGKGVVVKDQGAQLTVMTSGPILQNVLEAVRDLPVNLVYFHTIKPIDRELIRRFSSTRILVIQDAFGLREAIHEVDGVRTHCHGLEDEFFSLYGTLPQIRTSIGLDPAGIREFVNHHLEESR